MIVRSKYMWFMPWSAGSSSRALVVAAHRLWSKVSVVVAHRLSCPLAFGIELVSPAGGRGFLWLAVDGCGALAPVDMVA